MQCLFDTGHGSSQHELQMRLLHGILHFEQLVLTAPSIRITGSGMRRHDGTELPVDVTLSRIGSNGDTTALAIIRDATERLRIEDYAPTIGVCTQAGAKREIDQSK